MTYYSRFLEQKINLAVRFQKILLLFGARQTGKTTLLRHLMEDQKVYFINLQDRRLRRRYETDPGLLLRELEAQAGADTVVIDEIQKVPELLEDVQFLFDQDPSRWRFILTGSSARRLRRGSANLLPGRSVSHTLTPVMQAECRPCILLPVALPSEPRFPSRSLEDSLLYGSLPGLYSEGRDSWAETLATWADLYIENEIRQENIVRDMGAFSRFIELAAIESGRFINYTKMASAVGVAVNTLRNFFQVLEDTFLGTRVPPFTETRRRVALAPRFVLLDMGLRHALAGLRMSEDLIRVGAGELFEQWVMAELCHRATALGAGHSVGCWRTSGGAEVDAILRTPDEVIPVEIKWTDRPRPSDARHVETFLDLHPQAHRGFLVCRTPSRQALTPRVTALPWNEF
jgi:predicted AAA+ superfamily ATPase